MPVLRRFPAPAEPACAAEGGYVAPTGVCAQEVDRIAEVRDGGYVFIYASEEA